MSLKQPRKRKPAANPAAKAEADSSPSTSLANVEPDDEAKIERIAELLPPEKRGELLAVIEKTISHSGWLPMPSDLAAYEAVLPGLAERIVQMPEREQKHRHQFLDTTIDRDYKLKRRGQSFAIAAMALLLAFSAFLAFMGETAWAARVAIGTIVAVVGIFVTGKLADVKSAQGEKSEGE